ncbi:MAG: hypothetical protein WC389_07885 [Lutibacter sp.]|jgi:hypothetical protein
MSTIQNLSKGLKSQIMLMLFISLIMVVFSSCEDDDESPSPLATESFRNFDNGMHKLWADHMQWTFATVDAFFNNPEGLQAQLDRLLKNQENIGAAIVPYYGQAAGDQLTILLKGHINGAVPVLQAAKDNDQAALNQAITNWRANAKEIADFLSTANPEYLKQSDMQTEMDVHITQTIAYSVDLLQQNYNQAVIDYDDAFNHMEHFATMLSEGIANQFPDKF